MNVIGYPLRFDMPVRTTFADAPMIVPLPPKHAPIDTAHQSGQTSIPYADMVWISGISVATNGMLSSTAEQSADTHRITSMRIT